MQNVLAWKTRKAERFGVSCQRMEARDWTRELVERGNVPTIGTGWISSSTEFCVFYVQEISRQTNRQANKII